ncbi:hypothetical protein [Spirosoma areae]
MSQLASQTDLPTDAYSMTPSTTTPAKSGPDKNKVLAISAATLLLGSAAWAISQKITERGKQPSDNEMNTSNSPSPVALPADVDVAGKVTDGMSFEQAFGAARAEVGMGGVFSWHGRWYNTFEKEEWSGLSLQQRQEYTEQITGEKLPVKPYAPQVAQTPGTASGTTDQTEPVLIEGHLNGQRVMGLDFNHDGVIDTLVMDGADGYTYRVVDASGDDGLDTVYRYDSLDGELTGAVRIDHPFVLSNEQFSQGLEASMAKEVVDSILEPDASAAIPTAPAEDSIVDEPEPDEATYLADSHEPDDTYINNGDVRDMDE